MADLIEREALTDWLKSAGWFLKGLENSKVERKIIGKIIDHVEAMPISNAVEVVRCEECVHASVGDNSVYCTKHYIGMNADDYCSYGDKRGGE